MFSMMNLIKNESMKLIHRVSTWVMLGILIVTILLVGAVYKYITSISEKSDWKAQLQEQNKEYTQLMNQSGMNQAAKDEYSKAIEMNNYRIQHNIPTQGSPIWVFVNGCSGIIKLISLFAIIIGGGIVANEFSAGTIKLLLIRPLKRWKVLLSKYITVLFFILMMLGILFIISFIYGGLLFGFKGADTPYLKYSGDKIVEVNIVLHCMELYGLECVKLIMMVTLAFMISSVFRSSSLAIGIGIFLLFIGAMITPVLSYFKWSKYILFQNTDLSVYINGNPPVEGMTMTFSIIVLLVYFAIFMVTAFLVFNKRDVAA